jgi:hypothetical protein
MSIDGPIHSFGLANWDWKPWKEIAGYREGIRSLVVVDPSRSDAGINSVV